MQKLIKEMKNGICQVTTLDERWYCREVIDPISKLPTIKFVPSATWIAGCYPKGIEFYKWLAKHGWDESEAIKSNAGNRGTRIHAAIDMLLAGAEIKIDQLFYNQSSGKDEELEPDEYEAIMSFRDWFEDVKPKIIYHDLTVFSERFNFAGTLDFACEINGEIWIIDFKTGQYIYPTYGIQLTEYKQGLLESASDYASIRELDGKKIRLGILQIGYKANKYKKYKFTELEDKFPLFLAAYEIWKEENSKVFPHQKDYPLSIKLNKDVKPNPETKKEAEVGPEVQTPVKAGKATKPQTKIGTGEEDKKP
jgi:hypothetical protein